MHNHEEVRKSPYDVEQLFRMVAAVEQYPYFLPWCDKVKFYKFTETELDAALRMDFPLYSASYRSVVKLDSEKYEIKIDYVEGPFKTLQSGWKFLPLSEPEFGCMVDFHIYFEMKSLILESFVGSLVEKAMVQMVDAFENRAKKLYGQYDAAFISKNYNRLSIEQYKKITRPPPIRTDTPIPTTKEKAAILKNS